MTDVPTEYRFYGDLAVWWPLISPPQEYADEATYAATVLRSASIPVRDVLELGSGGGHSAVHLKARFAMTLVDLSAEMLEVSRRLNPECDHHQGDMRTVRLGRTFDAVFVHDTVDYMTSEADLRQAIDTAFVHCRPGGIALFVPDYTTETFEAASDHGGNDDADGSVRVVHETHRMGLFSRDVWLRLLASAGFDPNAVVEQTTEERTSRELFVGYR